MASMPDLIFTVLFFFMIVTHMRTETPMLKFTTPNGQELSKPENRHSLINLYVGKDASGTTSVQIGNNVLSVDQLAYALTPLVGSVDNDEELVINIRADKDTPMAVMTEVKKQLRNAGVLKIRYSATEEKK